MRVQGEGVLEPALGVFGPAEPLAESSQPQRQQFDGSFGLVEGAPGQHQAALPGQRDHLDHVAGIDLLRAGIDRSSTAQVAERRQPVGRVRVQAGGGGRPLFEAVHQPLECLGMGIVGIWRGQQRHGARCRPT